MLHWVTKGLLFLKATTLINCWWNYFNGNYSNIWGIVHYYCISWFLWIFSIRNLDKSSSIFYIFQPDRTGTQSVPVLISCVREMVTAATRRLLKHLVSMVTIWQAKKEDSGALFKRHVPESIQAKIPKEWNYTPLEAKGKEAANNSECPLTYYSCFPPKITFSFLLPFFPSSQLS